ncbi:MAG TPA: hypothetical protein VFF06_31405 [Polyangia bacterium]|nr:hypothetical protein [Polyangia bacterium]
MRIAIVLAVLTGAAHAQEKGALQNLKDTIAAQAKQLHVKTKGDGCDGDRVALKLMKSDPPKLDLSSCKDKSGQERIDCEQPLREAFKQEVDERAKGAAESKQRIACCENKKKKGCEDFVGVPGL